MKTETNSCETTEAAVDEVVTEEAQAVERRDEAPLVELLDNTLSDMKSESIRTGFTGCEQIEEQTQARDELFVQEAEEIAIEDKEETLSNVESEEASPTRHEVDQPGVTASNLSHGLATTRVEIDPLLSESKASEVELSDSTDPDSKSEGISESPSKLDPYTTPAGEMSEPQEVCEAIDRLLSKIEASDDRPTIGLTPEIKPIHEEFKVGDIEAMAMTNPEAEVGSSQLEEPMIDPTTITTPSKNIDDNEVEVSSIEPTNFPTTGIKLGDIHKVFISHIVSPSSFYCQLSSSAPQLAELMETIQATFTEAPEDTLLDKPIVGTLCCAQSPIDDKWYRAEVTQTHSDHVEVSFVDYGRTRSVPMGKLKAIGGLVTKIPRQALPCSLVDLEPVNSEWSADAVTKMKEVSCGKELEAIFRSFHHKKYDIYLRDPENDVADFVNKLLVDLKLAKVTGRDPESEEVRKCK